jgi:hypothetical protein
MCSFSLVYETIIQGQVQVTDQQWIIQSEQAAKEHCLSMAEAGD